jgi:hypothetical protein
VPFGLSVESFEAGEALRSAETDFASAFTAVSQAEKTGANVTVLIDRLNVANNLLSEGYVSYWNGDYETANSLATTCKETLAGIADEANQLRISAERFLGSKALLTAVFSGIGLIILFVLGFLGWGLLKRSYYKRLLGLRPVVEESQ